MAQNTSDELKDTLFPNRETEDKNSSNDEYLSLWKQYAETVYKVSDRRLSESARFLSIQGVLLSLVATILSLRQSVDPTIPLFCAAFLGILTAVIHLAILRSYRSLNNAKYKVLIEAEKKLSLHLYAAEGVALKQMRAGQRFASLSRVERLVPVLFILAFLGVAIIGIFL